jgi:hypothetical protein
MGSGDHVRRPPTSIVTGKKDNPPGSFCISLKNCGFSVEAEGTILLTLTLKMNAFEVQHLDGGGASIDPASLPRSALRILNRM